MKLTNDDKELITFILSDIINVSSKMVHLVTINYTHDLDYWLDSSIENLKRVIGDLEALKESKSE